MKYTQMVQLSNSNSSRLSIYSKHSQSVQVLHLTRPQGIPKQFSLEKDWLKRHYINLCILAPNYAHPPPPLNSGNIDCPPPPPEICF